MKNSEETTLQAFLEEEAPLQNFFVSRIGGPGAGLVHFYDEQGQEWLLPISDEVLNRRCIDYLRSIGAPFMTSFEDLERFRESREGGD